MLTEPPSSVVGEAVLQIEDLSKTFGGTRALIDVDLDIQPDEIHALVGHNGCGKSTLIKTLAGFHHPDPGARLWLGGEEVHFGAGDAAAHDSLRFVHQDLGHVLELGVLDNLALRGAYVKGRFGRINWAEQERAANELLERFDLHMDLYRPLSAATPVERVIVAIVAAVQGWQGGRGVLVLDEPTAVLPPHEVAELFRLIGEVRRTGASVLYVSHRMEEIFELADRVTVLRGGRVVHTGPADLAPRALATLMVGEDVDPDYRTDVASASDAPVALEARGIRARYLNGIDFTLHKGEVLGVAGLPGSGAEEVPYALAGALGHEASGTVTLAGDDRRGAIELGEDELVGLPLVPADRARQGVIAEMGVGDNLSISVLDRLKQGPRLNKGREAALVGEFMDRLSIRAASQDAPISTLSGGNQQKVVMARCLARKPSVLLLSEPTAGVDIANRIALYELIAEQAETGLGVILSSSDTQDLHAMCTRILVLRDGVIVRELRGDVSEAALHHTIEGTDQGEK
jgi:ABC-type sugar transport system ATPase subunit